MEGARFPPFVWRGCKIFSNRILPSLHLDLLQVGFQQEGWCGGDRRGKPAQKNSSAVLVLLENGTCLFRGGGD